MAVSIEEKIYQRQIMKGGMSAAVEGDADVHTKKSNIGRHFSKEELKELFTLNLVSGGQRQQFCRIINVSNPFESENSTIVLLSYFFLFQSNISTGDKLRHFRPHLQDKNGSCQDLDG